MPRGRLFVLVVTAAALLWATAASATTVRLGPAIPFIPESNIVCPGVCPGRTFTQLVSPQAADEAPASGVITAWRVDGAGLLKLRVLRFAGEGESELVGVGTSAPATNARGQANATSLPIRAGDVIGVDEPAGSGSEVGVENVSLDTASMLEWQPALAEGGPVAEPVNQQFSQQLLLNADIVLAPVVSSVSPASGGTAAGNAVKISGLFFLEGGATGVTFGSTPASSFTIDSTNQITAIAPASAASTVDVRVTGPGGSSEVVPGDRYTFVAPASTPATLTPRLIPGGPALGLAKLTLTSFGESAGRWRRGPALPHISTARRVPVGTTFAFSLNEPATVTLTFTHSVPGRRVAGRCVAPSHGNAHRVRCKRTVTAGSFGVSGKTGLNKLRFQGRLSSTTALKPGSYDVSITARDAHGLKSVSRTLGFTIVA
jgi:hypothetical protein